MPAGRTPGRGRPRYVYANGDAYGVYFLDWCEAHDGPRRASLTLSLGRWTDGAGREERTSFCVELRPDGRALAEQPARDRPAFFGRFLPRSRALEPAESYGVWHLVDHIAVSDLQAAAVMARLGGGADTAVPPP